MKKVLFVAGEALPFASSGGLGDVIGSLPQALSESGEYDVRVVMPLYSSCICQNNTGSKFGIGVKLQ